MIHFVISRLCCVIYNLASVHQHHKLIVVYMNHGTIRHDIVRSLFIFPTADQCSFGKNGLIPHIICFNDFQPLICKCTSNCLRYCLNNSHYAPPYSCFYLHRRLRNAKHRINTVFFVVKIKYLLKVYGKIELTRN